MGNASSWKQNGLTLIGVGVGVLFAAGVGMHTFMTSGAPIHPAPKDVPSVSHAVPSQGWAAAAEEGRRLARAGIVELNLPGLSVAVGASSEIVWAEGFGWADIDNRVPVKPETRFRIGHASKALTSAAVGLLLEKSRLRLDEEIQTYVPAYPKKAWRVTLRQLMGHVAGVRHYDSEADYMTSTHCDRASDGLRSFADDPLRFEPQTESRYSTFGWVLVSAAVEAAANEPFFSFMETKIFEPLGMADTAADSAAVPGADRATFYYPKFSGDPALGAELAAEVDYSCFAGAGAFLSTPSDLVRFGLALNNGKLLQPATVKLLQTREMLTSGEATEYGLGWLIETVPLAGQQARMASHASRTLLGGSTSFLTFPDRGLVVAVTSNTSFAATRSIALNIAQVFAEPRKPGAASETP